MCDVRWTRVRKALYCVSSHYHDRLKATFTNVKTRLEVRQEEDSPRKFALPYYQDSMRELAIKAGSCSASLAAIIVDLSRRCATCVCCPTCRVQGHARSICHFPYTHSVMRGASLGASYLAVVNLKMPASMKDNVDSDVSFNLMVEKACQHTGLRQEEEQWLSECMWFTFMFKPHI